MNEEREERWAARAGTTPAKNSRKRQLSRADVIRMLATGQKDFTEVQAIGVDFSRLDLRDCDFTGANLSRAKFNMADLTGANLSRTSLFQSSFNFCALDNVNFAESSWPGARFLECTMSNTILERLAQNNESLEDKANKTLANFRYRRP